MNIEEYIHGSCHLFALSMLEITKAPIILALDTFLTESGEEIEVLAHAFNFDGQQYIDIRGNFASLDEILEEFEELNHIYYIQDIDGNYTKSMISSSKWNDYQFGEKEKIQDYIQTMNKPLNEKGEIIHE